MSISIAEPVDLPPPRIAARPLTLWVIYRLDDRGIYICRQWRMTDAGFTSDDGNSDVSAKSIDKVRQALPKGLLRLSPINGDDQRIVELWV